MQNWEKKESPILSMLGFGGGGTGTALGGGASSDLLVSGGNSYHEDSTYSWYVFTSPGNLVVADNGMGSSLEGLVCGGGGGGGSGGDGRNATGGGGGGIAYFEVPANGFTATTYPVSVGNGGSGAGGRGNNSNSGGNSSFAGGYTVTGNGGGRGADWDRGPQASPGGSGGGFDTSQYSPSSGGSATQPGANPGVPWVQQQWGSAGGATYGGNPGFTGVPTGQHPDFQSTTASALPPYYPNIGANGPQYYAGRSGTDSSGGAGIVIVRTLKRTGPA